MFAILRREVREGRLRVIREKDRGSVIGPLLFVLLKNDIANLFNDGNCVCKLYADNLKLYSILETNVDVTHLQDKLANVYDWSGK